jgi:hypothetical protein
MTSALLQKWGHEAQQKASMSRAFSGMVLNEYRILGYDNNQKLSFARTCGKGPKVAFIAEVHVGEFRLVSHTANPWPEAA